MPVKSLNFTEVGPIDEIAIDFDQNVNVFIGPNNTGKSTVLWVLGELLVFPFTMPSRMLRGDQASWTLEISTPGGSESVRGKLPAKTDDVISVYDKIGPTCYVPAHRYGTNFRSPGPTIGQDAESRLDQELKLFYEEFPHQVRRIGIEGLKKLMQYTSDRQESPELARRRKLMLVGPSLASDEAVKQKIIDLDYAASRRNKPEIRAIIDRVASITGDITEEFVIKFDGVAEDEGGLFPQFDTKDGVLPQDVLSQGTLSIVHILAHMLFGFYAEYYDFPADLEEKPGILIVDEIDTHLHPSWQRRVLPALRNHLPNVQIFCSTHSSLALAGLEAGQVQLLRRDDADNRVTISRNESDVIGWSSDEILRHLMDVLNPTDLVTATNISGYSALMDKDKLSAEEIEELDQLRPVVRKNLLNGPMSDQVLRFAEELKRSREAG